MNTSYSSISDTSWEQKGVIQATRDDPLFSRLSLDNSAHFDRVFARVSPPTEPNELASKEYVDGKFSSSIYDAANVAITGGTIQGITDLQASLLRLPNHDQSNFVSLQANPSTSIDYVLQLPPTLGTAGYVLSTDGNGVTSWIQPPNNVLVGKHYVQTPGANAVSTNGLSISSATIGFDGTQNVVHTIELPQPLKTLSSPTFVAAHLTELRLLGSSSGTVSILGQANAGTYSLVLPPANGDGVLLNDGNGNLSWGSAGADGAHTIEVGNNGLTLTNAAVAYDTTQAVTHKLELPQGLRVTDSPTFVQVTHTSDARLKRNLAPIHDALSTIQKLEPVCFKWRKTFKIDDDKNVGFVAQNVKQCIPSAVKDVGGLLRVNNASITAYLCAAVQELATKLKVLQESK